MRVPLVIVTGFLGAGKTTLVNRLLAQRAARGATGKLGVIVNELGEVGIDGALLGSDSVRMVELPGGCVCCVLGDDLERTLLELVAAYPQPRNEIDAKSGEAEGLAAIVLETTGVAEPLPIAWALRRDPVAQVVRLAMVVTVVDAINFIPSQSVTPAVGAQVAYADVLLVSKADLVGDPTPAIEAARALAPRADVRVATTDVHVAWLEQVLADPNLEHVPAAPHDDDHDHDHGIASLALDIPGAIDLEELLDQLAELPATYVRIKGIAASAPGTTWVAFHRVGLRVSSEPLDGKPAGFADNRGRIVALGSDLRQDQLEACVRAALVP